jgi:hypothetical protein
MPPRAPMPRPSRIPGPRLRPHARSGPGDPFGPPGSRAATMRFAAAARAGPVSRAAFDARAAAAPAESIAPATRTMTQRLEIILSSLCSGTALPGDPRPCVSATRFDPQATRRSWQRVDRRMVFREVDSIVPRDLIAPRSGIHIRLGSATFLRREPGHPVVVAGMRGGRIFQFVRRGGRAIRTRMLQEGRAATLARVLGGSRGTARHESALPSPCGPAVLGFALLLACVALVMTVRRPARRERADRSEPGRPHSRDSRPRWGGRDLRRAGRGVPPTPGLAPCGHPER